MVSINLICYDSDDLNIYQIDPFFLEKYDIIKKGTQFDTLINADISTNTNKNTEALNFTVPALNDSQLTGHGLITMIKEGSRFSRSSELELAVNMLVLPDGQEVNISSSSFTYSSIHAPHASSEVTNLARTVSNIALASSPFTFGAGLGASFLINGALSAKQNGVGDFIWGGLSGSGFSFVENILRKQPNVSLESGTTIPMVLTEDLKISKAINKEPLEKIQVNKEEAISRIEKLIQWGDLTGALEYSIKTGQKDVYEELISKISS